MKGYYEQRYTYNLEVKVTLQNGDTFEDEIKGLNKGHALYLAKLNWEDCQVEAI